MKLRERLRELEGKVELLTNRVDALMNLKKEGSSKRSLCLKWMYDFIKVGEQVSWIQIQEEGESMGFGRILMSQCRTDLVNQGKVKIVKDGRQRGYEVSE